MRETEEGSVWKGEAEGLVEGRAWRERERET